MNKFKRISILGLMLALSHTILVILVYHKPFLGSSLGNIMNALNPEFFVVSWIFRMYSWGPGAGIYSGWLLVLLGGFIKWYVIGYVISLVMVAYFSESEKPKTFLLVELMISILLVGVFLIYAIPDYYGYWYKLKEKKEYVELVKNGELSELKVLYFGEIKNVVNGKKNERYMWFGTTSPNSTDTSDSWSIQEVWPSGTPNYDKGDLIKIYYLDKPQYYRYHVRRASIHNKDVIEALKKMGRANPTPQTQTNRK